jgi:small subunit ribosomal protein S18
MSQNQNARPERGERPERQERRHFFKRRKVCMFCEPSGPKIDYKDVKLLSKFVSERGRIIPRRITSVSADHQRALATAIKRARFLALLPYAAK